MLATHAGIVFNALCANRSSRRPRDDFNASIPIFVILFLDRFTFRSAGLSLNASPTSRTSHSAHANVFSSFNPFTALKSSIPHSLAMSAASACMCSTPRSVFNPSFPLTLSVRIRGQLRPSAANAFAPSALFSSDSHVSALDSSASTD